MLAFGPGRILRNHGERRRGALGEALGAEALELIECLGGELLGMAALGHAADQLLSEWLKQRVNLNVAMARRCWSASVAVILQHRHRMSGL